MQIGTPAAREEPRLHAQTKPRNTRFAHIGRCADRANELS